MKIIINGEQVETDKTQLDYYQIVDLAFGKPMMALQTITYYAKTGKDSSRSGIVYPRGPSVEICEDMRINCCYTGNA